LRGLSGSLQPVLRCGWMPAPDTAAIGSVLAAPGLLGAGGRESLPILSKFALFVIITGL
jgi:hypothetical protein